ncbi:hypothetical protein [Streptomyces sp. ISL-11]|uniref:hypothetical protein n=1 Tax=Streptomyces sp. ISL-11 TaxID=2819174 RepID=UPI001BEA96A7|nr:hypothetical protein [Streptomyces sp. ISL-11]MBT2382092.1 hypothetical protein [Streptomyces sp. ISL-11]
MNPEIMGDFRPVIDALYRLLGQFPNLPAAEFSFGTIVYRGEVMPGMEITRHGSFADFEAWREALSIDATTVTWKSNNCANAPYQLLRADGTFNGTPVLLACFTSAALAPEPVTAPAG